MFKAILLLCIPNTFDCIEAHDNKFLHNNIKQCVERVHEIAKEITELQSVYIPKAYRCILNGEPT